MLLTSLLAVPLAFAPQSPASKPAAPAKAPAVRDLDAELEPIRAKHDLPALAGAVIRSRGLEALGAVGVRKRGAPERVTRDDLFHIGSCTKSMTATMIATYVDEKKLAWTTTLADGFPDLAKSHADWKGVTLEQLLGHRAGVPSDLSADGLWERLWQRKGTPVEQRMDLTRSILAKPPVHAPGTKFLYANAGFGIAAALLEKKVGKPWEDLMRERLFKPLGITSAGFDAPGTPGKVDQPWGHGHDGAPIDHVDNPPAIGPGGTVHMSMADWGRYVAAHLRGARGEKGILRAETFGRLHTACPSTENDNAYGFGWSITQRPWAGPKANVLTHNGSNTQWFAVVWIAPDRDFAVIAATNQGGDAGARATDEVAAAMIRFARDNP